MMFELVPSEAMRAYFKEIGFEFTDSQKATLIYNAPNRTKKEIMAALRELADTTSDEVTRKQIEERLTYEKKAYDTFIVNRNRRYVYVVIDEEDGTSCGFFASYERALVYALKYQKKWETKCSIEKQLIIQCEEDETVLNPGKLNPNLGFKDEEQVEYDGHAVAEVSFDERGEITALWTKELLEEDKIVDEYKKERFEHQFVKIPYDLQAGALVIDLEDGQYGVLSDGKKDWDEYMNRIEEKGWFVDFADVQVIMYRLTEDGYWSHEHVNPLYLDYALPAFNGENEEKDAAFLRATEMLHDYFVAKDKGEILPAEPILETVREYARLCAEKSKIRELAETATTVEGILW